MTPASIEEVALSSAAVMAKETLELCLEVMIENRAPPPAFSHTDDIPGRVMMIIAGIAMNMSRIWKNTRISLRDTG